MRHATRIAACIFVVSLSACTYGPLEDLTRVVQIVPLGDSFTALVVIGHDRYRRPTGLSAFPDGGKLRYDDRQVVVVRIDAAERSAVEISRQGAPDSLWESFSAGVKGLEGDSVAYLARTGCPRGGECHPALQKTDFLRLSTGGEARPVSEVPPSAGLPGVMLARRRGEANYVRFSREGDLLTARFEEGGVYEPLFRVRPGGILDPVSVSESRGET